MTIVTKPLNDKKDEKNQEPLVGDIKIVVPEKTNAGERNVSEERSSEHPRPGCYYIMRRKKIAVRKFPIVICVLFCLMFIIGIPILARFLRAKYLSQFYHEWCPIPYDPQNAPYLDESSGHIFQNYQPWLRTRGEKGKGEFFSEEFEIEENVEKITVPDFRGGKNSRFIHDFKTNITGIVDLDGRKCFVMPLNRTLVLPPEDLVDLVKKMNDGYYDVNTSVLRETMRVVTPAVENRADLGTYIMSDCYGYPIYKLEKYTSPVFKRSASSEAAQFTVFSGKGTRQLDIINYSDIFENEVQGPIAMA